MKPKFRSYLSYVVHACFYQLMVVARLRMLFVICIRDLNNTLDFIFVNAHCFSVSFEFFLSL